MTASNPPANHHYIPQFILSGWVDPFTNELFRYTEPYPGKIMVKSVGTAAAGFEKHLYTIPGVDDQYRQTLETNFFQRIDSDAAIAYQLLITGKIRELTSQQRVSWVRFILMMLLRTPRNLQAYKIGFEGAWRQPVPSVTARYEKIWQPGYPATAEEFIDAQMPDLLDHIVMRELPNLAQNEAFGQHLLRMLWFVLRVEGARFLISDEPVVMQLGLAKPGGHLAMPLSAESMFVATFDVRTFESIKKQRPTKIVKMMNKLLVQRASCFVGARDMSLDTFIRKHFGTKPAPSIATLFAEKYREDS